MATDFNKTLQYIFPEAANKTQSEKPWWASGNTLSSRKAKKVGSRNRRRNVFYDPQTGSQPSSGRSSDLELIREIMTPRSSVVTNDPSGWLNGGAEKEFQKFFTKTPEQQANYDRRLKELNAGGMAAMNPQAGKQVVDVARQNQEAMDMIFPKAPKGQPKMSSDIASYPMAGGGVQNMLDGRYGTGSATIQPKQAQAKAPVADWNSWSIPSAGGDTFPPTSSSNEFVGPPNLGVFTGPPNLGVPQGPQNFGETTGPVQNMQGPPDWANSSAWDYQPLPQNEADNIRTIAGRGSDAISRGLQVFNPFMTFSTLKQGGQSALPDIFGPQPIYPNANERLAGDFSTIKNAQSQGLLKTNRTQDRFGTDQTQLMRPFFKGSPVPFKF